MNNQSSAERKSELQCSSASPSEPHPSVSQLEISQQPISVISGPQPCESQLNSGSSSVMQTTTTWISDGWQHNLLQNPCDAYEDEVPLLPIDNHVAQDEE